jgi:hypothetical protein
MWRVSFSTPYHAWNAGFLASKQAAEDDDDDNDDDDLKK